MKVPSAQGLSVADATAAIESAGFVIKITGDTSNPAYGIISQTPAAASKVAKSSVVTVTVGESVKQAAERVAAEQAVIDEAARVEAERVAAEQAAAAEVARVEAERVAAEQAAAAQAAAIAAAGTVSQQNALRSAQDYLEYTSFSRTGLIEQLEYEGFSTGDATWGVDRVAVDWNVQAGLQAKDYLEYSAFSRSGLLDQLLYEGFTPEQAEYGVSQTGL